MQCHISETGTCTRQKKRRKQTIKLFLKHLKNSPRVIQQLYF